MEKTLVERYQKILIGNAEIAALMLASIDPYTSYYRVIDCLGGIKHFQWESVRFITGETYSVGGSCGYHASMGFSYETFEAAEQYKRSLQSGESQEGEDAALEAILDQIWDWQRTLRKEVDARIEHASKTVYSVMRAFDGQWPITLDQLIAHAKKAGISTAWVPNKSMQPKKPAVKGPDLFYEQLERLLVEIEVALKKKGRSLDRNEMPATRAELHKLFVKCSVRFDELEESSFLRYLKHTQMHFSGRPSKDFYLRHFPDGLPCID